MAFATEGGTTTTYGYDANGNRISVNGATVATYNARDQLLTYGDNTYTWNADSGLATKVMPSGTTHYTWNALGELTDVALPDGTAIHYLYDGMGRRVGKVVNGTLVAGYLYAGGRIVAETDAGGNVTERFVYATKANVPSYFIKYNADGTSGTYRIVSDQVGSVREVIAVATGAVVQRIDYDVWGMITNDTSPGFQPFGFAGGLYDAETGLVHFGARDYDPGTGRWISRDPILFAGGDANLYRYVVDDPVNLTDMLGLQSGWGEFVSTFTNGNSPMATSQGAAAMAAVGQAQQIAMAAQVAGAQCVWSQFRNNFAYYSSALPSIMHRLNPLQSPRAAGDEVARATALKSLEAMMRGRAANANGLDADIWNARAANVGRVGNVGESLAAVVAGSFLGAGIDAAGATLTSSLPCSCGG